MTDRTPCRIISRSGVHIRFAVDGVEPKGAGPKLRPLGAAWRARLGEDPIVSVGPERCIAAEGHGLLQAVSVAHATHRCLVLGPDDIWLTIAQGLTRHVNEHAEALREAMGVDFAGRRDLLVALERLPEDAAAWSETINAFARAIEKAHPDSARRFLAEFSTTGPIERTAGRIGLMSAYRQYYDFAAMGICGIPEVELRGTVEDWAELSSRVDALTLPGLEDWLIGLRPIAAQLVASRDGQPPQAFWRGIYQQREVYGGHEFTGWIGELFPYLGDEGALRNDGLWRTIAGLPSGLVEAEVTAQAGPVTRHHRLAAGFIGAWREGNDLGPALGWCVLPATAIATALEALGERARVSGYQPHQRFVYQPGSGEAAELAARCPGLVLEGDRGAVTFLPPSEWRWLCRGQVADVIQVLNGGSRIATFPGGFLNETDEWRGEHSRRRVLAQQDDGSVRAVAPGWCAYLLRVAETSDPLYFLDNEPLDIPMAALPRRRDRPWDGVVEDWVLEEQVTERRLVMDLQGVGLAAVAFLRKAVATFRAMSSAEALRSVRALDSRVLHPTSDADAARWGARLDALGIRWTLEVERTLSHRAEHLPSGERAFLPAEVVAEMRRLGVPVRERD